MLNGFMVGYNGSMFSESDGLVAMGGTQHQTEENGSVKETVIYRDNSEEIEVRNIIKSFPMLNIKGKWIEVTNMSKNDINVTKIDSYHGMLPKCNYMLKYYKSQWGKEFMPVDLPLDGTRILEATSGRSSNGTHPWFSVIGEDGSILTCSIAWSGNWIARFEPNSIEGYHLSGGLSNWNFLKKTGTRTNA